MVQASTARSERINLRLSEIAKRRIERAASAEGKPSAASSCAAHLKSPRGLSTGTILGLAREDALHFFDALADPPAPNQRLRAALEEHARRVDSR